MSWTRWDCEPRFMKNKPSNEKPTTLHWRWHDSTHKERRIWRAEWPGDMFEVVNEQEFTQMRKYVALFHVVFEECLDD